MVSDSSDGVNWRIIFATAGLIIGIALGATGASLYYTEKQQQEAVATNANTKNQRKIPQQYLTPRAGMPATIHGVISNPQPTTGQDHEKRDLAAQEASATFAWWMVVVTVFSVLITGLGTVLLYQQIILTREAVEDTGKATAAMVRQNELTERTQRPWLVIENFEITRFEFHQLSADVSVKYNIRNIGNMPAVDILSWHIGSFPDTADAVSKFEKLNWIDKYYANPARQANLAPMATRHVDSFTRIECGKEFSVFSISINILYRVNGSDEIHHTSNCYLTGRAAVGDTVQGFSNDGPGYGNSPKFGTGPSENIILT